MMMWILLEGGEEAPALGPLLPHHPAEFIMGMILICLLTLVMWKSVVPKFEAMYAERTAAIEGGMERAATAQAEAQAALAQYQAQLADARDESARIREDAKAQGAQIVAEMRAQAQAEAERITAQAQAQIRAERNHAIAQLRSEVGSLATGLAGKIVGEALTDDERARRTVDRFIAELEAQPETTELV